MSVYQEGRPHGVLHALGYKGRLLHHIGGLLQKDKELILARPGYGALSIQRFPQAVGHGL